MSGDGIRPPKRFGPLLPFDADHPRNVYAKLDRPGGDLAEIVQRLGARGRPRPIREIAGAALVVRLDDIGAHPPCRPRAPAGKPLPAQTAASRTPMFAVRIRFIDDGSRFAVPGVRAGGASVDHRTR